jgi:hypothetical protein
MLCSNRETARTEQIPDWDGGALNEPLTARGATLAFTALREISRHDIFPVHQAFTV